MKRSESYHRNYAPQGFSLIELVIVVVIIGIIGAIAIPRLSRGSEGASDAALKGNLSVLRNAIDHYAAEHGGAYPTYEVFEDQILKFSDANGNTSDTQTGAYIYGPYLRKLPPVPVGPNKGQSGVTDDPGEPGAGWLYDDITGEIKANTTTEKDVGGKLYNVY